MKRELFTAMIASLLILAVPRAAAAAAAPVAPVFPAAVPLPVVDETPPAQPREGSPRVRRVEVIRLDQLPASVREDVDQQVAATSPDDMQALRRVIDETPQLAGPLAESGAKSSQVVAAILNDEGVLTLVISA